MRARRLTPADLAGMAPADLAGAVLLAPVRLQSGTLQKGLRLDAGAAARILAEAGWPELAGGVRAAWPDADDLHEDVAAERLALAVGGAGIEARPPRQSRLDLAALWDGVLHVRAEALTRLNAIDPLEVFTLYHGQAVAAGTVVAAVKIAPHLVPAERVAKGVRLARAAGPLVEVRPYRPMDVAAIAAEVLRADALRRFETGARRKVEALGSTFLGVESIGSDDPAALEAAAREALERVVLRRRVPVVLVGGVSAGDPLSSFYAALESLGGEVLRRGVPAHPGSMIWLARLGESRLLGLPQCGMFSMATAADLVLPRLLTGEALDAAGLAELGHGGLLVREMRFRFPPYAQDLAAPEG